MLAFLIADGGPGSAEPGRATADLDGRFSIDRLRPGSYRVLVEAAGFPAAETSPVTAPASELVLRLSGEGRSIPGRVTLGSDPAAGAEVMLGDEAGGPVRDTQSSADGRFAFSGLGDGSYALRALRGRLAAPTTHGIAAARDGTKLPAPLVLAPGQTIAGRLVQDAGAPLVGFEVRVESVASAEGGEDPLPTVARTDKNGAFTAGPLATGSYRLTAVRPAMSCATRRRSTCPRQAASRRLFCSSSCVARG